MTSGTFLIFVTTFGIILSVAVATNGKGIQEQKKESPLHLTDRRQEHLQDGVLKSQNGEGAKNEKKNPMNMVHHKQEVHKVVEDPNVLKVKPEHTDLTTKVDEKAKHQKQHLVPLEKSKTRSAKHHAKSNHRNGKNHSAHSHKNQMRTAHAELTNEHSHHGTSKRKSNLHKTHKDKLISHHTVKKALSSNNKKSHHSSPLKSQTSSIHHKIKKAEKWLQNHNPSKSKQHVDQRVMAMVNKIGLKSRVYRSVNHALSRINKIIKHFKKQRRSVVDDANGKQVKQVVIPLKENENGQNKLDNLIRSKVKRSLSIPSSTPVKQNNHILNSNKQKERNAEGTNMNMNNGLLRHHLRLMPNAVKRVETDPRLARNGDMVIRKRVEDEGWWRNRLHGIGMKHQHIPPHLNNFKARNNDKEVNGVFNN